MEDALIARREDGRSLADIPTSAHGILPHQLLKAAVAGGAIVAPTPIPDSSYQPASLDLRLSDHGWRLRTSFLPGSEPVENRLADISMGEIDLRKEAILERNRPYLIPLMEQLHLPKGFRAKANPRSSTGRMDVFTRVITDEGIRFDEISEGYEGGLYLEIVPLSFTVSIREGTSLNQVRLIKGDASTGTGTGDDSPEPTLFRDGAATAWLPEMSTVFLTVDLDLKGRNVGYRARANSGLLDLSKKGIYEPEDFWEPVSPDRQGRLILEPETFYLLVSRETVRVPPNYAAEMTAYDPTSGELRTHYAGFFDPGFGYSPVTENVSSRAVMEVRAHDVPFMIEHGQDIARLEFSRMLDTPDVLYGEEQAASSYQGQDLFLSKHFVRSGNRKGKSDATSQDRLI
jgi:dCTP deaminase